MAKRPEDRYQTDDRSISSDVGGIELDGGTLVVALGDVNTPGDPIRGVGADVGAIRR